MNRCYRYAFQSLLYTLSHECAQKHPEVFFLFFRTVSMAAKKEHRSSRCCAKCEKTSWARCVPSQNYFCRQCFRSHLEACVTCKRKVAQESETERQVSVVGATPTTSSVGGATPTTSRGSTLPVGDCSDQYSLVDLASPEDQKEHKFLDIACSMLVETIVNKKKKRNIYYFKVNLKK
jgi:hypothetical protein